MAESAGSAGSTGGDPLREFLAVMRRLRAECPWKREQTHRSLVRYLLEEAHETVEAIETGTPDDLREELGDLLLQVYFHAVVAEESGGFTLDDVARDIVAKMVRRNPHVFGGPGRTPAAGTATEVNELWESVKAHEKQRTDVTEGLASSLPALLYADKVLDRLRRAGRELPGPGPTPAGPVLLLVPSPLLGAAGWGGLPWWLRGAGREVGVVDLPPGPPTPEGVVEAVVAAADGWAGREVVLVLHSNAGRYGPLLARRLSVAATVYLDAALAAVVPPGERDGETALAPAALLDAVRPLADGGDGAGLLPPWTEWWGDAVDPLFPDATARATLEAGQPRVTLGYLASRVAVPAGWADAPAAYLGLGDTYADELAQARAAGWPTARIEGGHLHALVDPAAVGAALLDLLDRLGGLRAPAPDRLAGERLLAEVATAHAAGVDPEQALRDAVRRLLAR